MQTNLTWKIPQTPAPASPAHFIFHSNLQQSHFKVPSAHFHGMLNYFW